MGHVDGRSQKSHIKSSFPTHPDEHVPESQLTSPSCAGEICKEEGAVAQGLPVCGLLCRKKKPSCFSQYR